MRQVPVVRLVVATLFAFVLSIVSVTAQDAAAPTERRVAFVVGNESYADGALPTAANDAGLIAQTLQAAGFDVVGARDLDAETFRQSYADFLQRVRDAGPGSVAFVYLAGYGLQYGNENYYVPTGAKVARDTDIPIDAVRLSDLTGPLNALDLKARFMVFDTSYTLPFRIEGAPLAGGLALIDSMPGSLIAFNAAPGTVARPGKGNYGAYAQSLAAEMREGGLSPDEIFDRVRLRVNEETQGAAVPWDASKIDQRFVFFERGPDAPASKATPAETTALIRKPLRDLPPKQAYVAAVARDDVRAYSEFGEAYPDDPMAKRVRLLLAARREALTWRRTVASDTPAGYWSYLARYPHGPHASAARLRLGELSAALEPPPDFGPIDYDVPPPPAYELDFLDQPALYFDDPDYGLPPPPPPPDYWLPPVPAAFADLGPPPPPDGLFFLPVPAFVPLPGYYNPPQYVAYSQNRFFSGPAFDRSRPIGLGARGIVSDIHRGFPGGGIEREGRRVSVALPAAALQRATALGRRGISTPAELRAARQRPGGLDGAGPGGPGRNAVAPERRLPGAEGGRALPGGERRGPGGRGPNERGAGPGDRGPAERGPAGRDPDRGLGDRRLDGARDPGDRGRGAGRAGDREPGRARGGEGRGPDERGNGARNPDRRDNDRSNNDRRDNDRRDDRRGAGDRPGGDREPGARGPRREPEGRGPGAGGPGRRGAEDGRGPQREGPGADRRDGRGEENRGGARERREPAGERGPRQGGPGGGPGGREPGMERGPRPGGPGAGRPPGDGGPRGGREPGGAGMGRPPGGDGGPRGGPPGGGGGRPGAGPGGGGMGGGPGAGAGRPGGGGGGLGPGGGGGRPGGPGGGAGHGGGGGPRGGGGGGPGGGGGRGEGRP